VRGQGGGQALALKATVMTVGRGQALTVHITGIVSGNDTDSSFQGTLTNTATANAGNESAAEQNDQDSASITIAAPDVDVSQSVDSSSINQGDTAGFTVTLRNEGTGTATGVILFDVLWPGQAADLSWTIDAGSGTPSAFTL